MNARACAALGTALFLVGCGGEQGERPAPAETGLPLGCGPILPLSTEPDPGSGPVDCAALDGYELSSDPGANDVPRWHGDDFESVAANSWYTNNDRTADQTPTPDSDPVLADPIPGGRCLGVPGQQSRFAIHIQSGVLTDYGGSFGSNMPRTALPLPCPYTSPTALPIGGGCPMRQHYPAPIGPCSIGLAPNTDQGGGCVAGIDASQWEGVVLWARKAQGSQSTIRLSIGDFRTDDSNQACQCNNTHAVDPTLPVNGLTNPLVSVTNQNDTSDGCDKYGMFMTMDGTWRPYLLPFDHMQQGGWGRPSPQILTSNIFSLGIGYGRGAWDFWIDDIAFYRRRK